jgi:hypothetical protein
VVAAYSHNEQIAVDVLKGLLANDKVYKAEIKSRDKYYPAAHPINSEYTAKSNYDPITYPFRSVKKVLRWKHYKHGATVVLLIQFLFVIGALYQTHFLKPITNDSYHQ